MRGKAVDQHIVQQLRRRSERVVIPLTRIAFIYLAQWQFIRPARPLTTAGAYCKEHSERPQSSFRYHESIPSLSVNSCRIFNSLNPRCRFRPMATLVTLVNQMHARDVGDILKSTQTTRERKVFVSDDGSIVGQRLCSNIRHQ